MGSLPAGTVTFLFTDIEGSTRLLQQLGDRYASVLADHHRLLRASFTKCGGTEVQDHGDGLYFTFPSARAAVQAAVAAQRAMLAHGWPGEASVRVRMGLHTGEPMSAETGLVGLDVHRAARICSAAHGGQILISESTHALVVHDLPDGTGLRDLGEHRLKDLARAEQLFQIVADDLPAEFAPLRSLSVLPNNLPHQWTSFIGREREIADARRLIEAHRLVTLTGIGGSGKTRLAIQIGADLLATFPEGVWLVEQAAISDPALVPRTAATALGIVEHPRQPLLTALVEALKPRRLLLILDNCEHLLAACAHLAETLLGACEQVRVLATSREALGIPGEATYPVPSLSIPEMPALDLNRLTDYEAVRLFADRAAAAVPGFALAPENAAAVATICLRLDGIPLAIELAAPRVKAMTVEQLSERLHDRYRLLTGGRRTALPRHQTLQAAMDWSHDLLTTPEKAVLRRLSVFAGGFTLEAAEAVCAGEDVPAADLLDLLTRLVEKSLVIFQEREARYRLLETVRQYGSERLMEAGESEQARTRHRDFFLALAESAVLRGPESVRWTGRLEAEHDNSRAALAWSHERGDTEAALRMVGALGRYWLNRSHFAEGLAWLERVLSGPGPASTGVRARAILEHAMMALNVGDLELSLEKFQESVALSREAGDQATEMRALINMGFPLVWGRGDVDGAAATVSQGLALARRLGDRLAEGAGLFTLAMVVAREDIRRSIELLEEDLVIGRELGDPWGLEHALSALGFRAQILGDYRRAEALFQEALEHIRSLGGPVNTANHLASLGALAAVQCDYGRARALFEESLALYRRAGDRFFIVGALQDFGWLNFNEGDVERATALFEESLALARRGGNKGSVAVSLRLLGITATHRGELERADEFLGESMALAREGRAPLAVAGTLSALGTLARRKGDPAQAGTLLKEALEIRKRFENRLGIAECLEGLAGVALDTAAPECAARLFGAADALRKAIGAPLPPVDRPAHERDVATARAALGEAAVNSAWREGQRMTVEHAVRYALEA